MNVEQRRTKRFALQLPLAIKRLGTATQLESGLTANISSSGVLFTSQSRPSVGGVVEYSITLNPGEDTPVNVRCVGKVLRCRSVDEPPEPTRYQVAVTLERYEFVRLA